jgi:hypothetical protein
MKKPYQISAEELIHVLEAAMGADYPAIRRVVGEIAQAALAKGDEETAKRLRPFIRRRGVPIQASAAQQILPVDSGSRLPLIDEEPWPTTPVILNESVRTTVERFLHDIQNSKRLSEGGLLARFGLMLSGPPGTGKTLLAGHIAAQLRRPFYIARLDSLISARLGETAKNIRQIFEYAPAKGAVLLLDEIDAVAKMRDDRHELGELKRVVNTVIQGLDSLSEDAVIVGATNHPQLLDPAIWRRFPYRVDIGLPDMVTRSELWQHFLYEGKKQAFARAELLAIHSEGFSGADIENVALAARRLALLNETELPEASVLNAVKHSEPPNLSFPKLTPLSAEEKRQLVRWASANPDTNKSVLADITQISRAMIYKYLQDGAHD